MDENTKEKRGSLYFAYPAYVGSRIALLLKISNAEAHAIEYTKESIYETMDIKHLLYRVAVLKLRSSVCRR